MMQSDSQASKSKAYLSHRKGGVHRPGPAQGEVSQPAPGGNFTIQILTTPDISPTQATICAKAADRWTRIILEDIPSYRVQNSKGPDLTITVKAQATDGLGHVLGSAGRRRARTGSLGLDSLDLQNMERNGTLLDVVTHEMGHILGFGLSWSRLTDLSDPENPVFIGPYAMAEYGRSLQAEPTPVPIENVGDPGSIYRHWRESLMPGELMSTAIGFPGNPIGRLTIASLRDIGYTVDMDAWESAGRIKRRKKVPSPKGYFLHPEPDDEEIAVPTN